MNMKLVKYMLIAILVLGTGEVAAQVQVVSGKVTEMLGNQIEPIVGANVNIVNAQNRSVGGAVTNLDGDYRLQIPAQENIGIFIHWYENETNQIYWSEGIECKTGIQCGNIG